MTSDELLTRFREIVREEIAAALGRREREIVVRVIQAVEAPTPAIGPCGRPIAMCREPRPHEHLSAVIGGHS